MTKPVLFVGEDVLTTISPEGEDIQAKVDNFHRSGLWEEVVRGLADLTVKYDPLTMSAAEAEQHFHNLWNAPLQTKSDLEKPLTLGASFADGDAPDRHCVAAALGIEVDALAEWIVGRCYRVTMMGFQPGFGYLEDMDAAALPSLTRLTTPRQRVAAGSIGFLGARACIYAIDGPGGWPIVGRVCEPLLRSDDPQDFLLKPGQALRFRAL